MTDSGAFLEKLSAFSRILLAEGLIVSPRETEDACRVIMALGLEDRNQVKTALRTVYAKSREEQITFDRIFDSFFLPEEVLRAQNRQFRQEMDARRHRAEEELQFNGKPMDFSARERMAYGAIDQESRQKLQAVLKKYGDSAARNPQLYSNFVHSIFSRAILEQQLRMEDGGVNHMGSDPELGLLYREMSEFTDADIPRAIRLIQTVTRQLNGELSAKRAGHGQGHALDFRRTIRKGLETGGSLYRLKYRKKPLRRRHLVVLCDVSGSMIQFSEFALRFIQNLNRTADHARVFLFSEGLHEADNFSTRDLDRFRSYVRRTGLYGKGTGLAQALEAINRIQPAVLNPSTTLLILSDTRTTGRKQALKALSECKRLAGQVIILNPIPQRRWKYLPGVQAFSGAATMISCATLRDLAAACRKITQK